MTQASTTETPADQPPPTSLRPCKHGVRGSRTRTAMLARWLQRLQVALAALTRPERRSAIECLPPRARVALLDFMESDERAMSVAHKSGSAALSLASGRLEVPLVASRLSATISRKRCRPEGYGIEQSSCHRSPAASELAIAAIPTTTQFVLPPGRGQLRTLAGVRATRGLFQATVSFNHILVRSNTSRSRLSAMRFLDVLRHFKQLALESAERNTCEAEECIRCAHSEALAECHEALRPSYCTFVNLGRRVGKVESPTTASLDQVLNWRRRLLHAKSRGLSCLRSAWVELMQEERPGHSMRLSACAAEARADKFFQRNAGNALSKSLSKAGRRRDKTCLLLSPRRAQAERAEQKTARANARAKLKAEARIAIATDKIALLTKRLSVRPAWQVCLTSRKVGHFVSPRGNCIKM